MSDELVVLRDAVARLERAGIPYMLTGSIASSYYAEPRMTRDVDVVVELAGRDAKWVVAQFSPDKLAWARDSGSDLQMRDVRSLLAGGADRTYLEHWASELAVTDLLRQILDAGHHT